MSSKPTSTLAFEKKWNPALQLDRDDFIEVMAKSVLPKPVERGDPSSEPRARAIRWYQEKSAS